jgi:hypothetical protein
VKSITGRSARASNETANAITQAFSLGHLAGLNYTKEKRDITFYKT